MEKYVKDINKYYFNLLLKREKVFYSIKDDKVYLSDKYIISIINKDDLLINIEQLNCVDLTTFINKVDIDNYTKLKDWYIKDKISCLFNDEYKVNISKKYLELYYGKDFYIYKENQPVIVKIEDDIIGFLLPIKEY